MWSKGWAVHTGSQVPPAAYRVVQTETSACCLWSAAHSPSRHCSHWAAWQREAEWASRWWGAKSQPVGWVEKRKAQVCDPVMRDNSECWGTVCTGPELLPTATVKSSAMVTVVQSRPRWGICSEVAQKTRCILYQEMTWGGWLSLSILKTGKWKT